MCQSGIRIFVKSQQDKSEGFDSCDWPSNLSEIRFNRRFFSVRVTLTFDGWPPKIIGHLFYTSSNSVHHFKAIGESKLELQSGNVQFGPKSVIVLSCVTLQFDGWSWKTIGHLFYVKWSFAHHFKAIGEFELELQSGNAQFGSKSAIYCPVWPWNLTDDPGKQQGTSSMWLQALCIIS